MKNTKIIAGTLEVSGEVKNYEFTTDTIIFKFVINPLDPSKSISVELPRPKESMVAGIQRLGVGNLGGAVINFNKSSIDIEKTGSRKKTNPASKYVPEEKREKIGSGAFF